MSKVTSKLQVTLPKALAERYGIRPGDEIQWEPAGDAIRIIPAAAMPRTHDVALRLRLFDRATARQREREASGSLTSAGGERGWTREDLYERGGAD
jgi:AbrB family looped-hinge helix DNA binding protein